MTPVRCVSAIVCTRNRAARLPAVIDQLRGQTYDPRAYEIIIVDNGSTDTTHEVVQHYAATPGPAVRYICEARPGITQARNRGAEAARYPYLAYLDDDCTIQPDWLDCLMAGYGLDRNVAVAGGQVVLDLDGQTPPTWLGSRVEKWLASNVHLGNQPLVQGDDARVIECNMVVTKAAWQQSGGFLGMEQFGSNHMAAGEVIYLLKQVERQGGKVAYVPAAVAHHHTGVRRWQWMVRRAYWQGVSDGLLDYLVTRRSWLSALGRAVLNGAAMVIFFVLAGFSFLFGSKPDAMFHLLRGVRRFGLILSGLRLVGDWTRIYAWVAAQPVPSLRTPRAQEQE